VVNVDDPAPPPLNKSGGKHLHVSGQDNPVNIVRLQEGGRLLFYRHAVLTADGNHMKGNPAVVGKRLEIGMI